MVFAGMDGLQVLRRMQNRSGAIQHAFLERSQVLNQIRSDVYLSGTYARDYLLDPESAAAEKNRAELTRLRREMDAILAGYAGLMRPEERTPFDGLRRSLDDYWQVLDPVFQWSPGQRSQNGFRFLRDEVFPPPLDDAGVGGSDPECERATVGRRQSARGCFVLRVPHQIERSPWPSLWSSADCLRYSLAGGYWTSKAKLLRDFPK